MSCTKRWHILAAPSYSRDPGGSTGHCSRFHLPGSALGDVTGFKWGGAVPWHGVAHGVPITAQLQRQCVMACGAHCGGTLGPMDRTCSMVTCLPRSRSLAERRTKSCTNVPLFVSRVLVFKTSDGKQLELPAMPVLGLLGTSCEVNPQLFGF